MERYEAFACEECGGTGSVRVHGAEDYGVSFEAELCEKCGGTRVDVGALQAAYQGAVDLLHEAAPLIGNYAPGRKREDWMERYRDMLTPPTTGGQ